MKEETKGEVVKMVIYNATGTEVRFADVVLHRERRIVLVRAAVLASMKTVMCGGSDCISPHEKQVITL